MSRESLSLTFRGLPVHFSIVRPEAHLRHRLLFLCSPLLTGFHWRKLLPELSELGCLCVLAELPGFGQGAAAYAHPHDSATRARLIWGVLDEVDARVGGQNALWHLAAHGCACSTVMAMSAAQPDSVQSLIEISPLIPAGGRGRYFAGRKGAAAQLLEQSFSCPSAFSAFVERAARRPVPDYSVERMWASLSRPGGRGALLRLLEGEDAVPPQRGFCPAMAIWGGSDPLMPADEREQLTALQPEVEAHIIRAAGHFPMETHSRALRDYLRGWLKYVG